MLRFFRHLFRRKLPYLSQISGKIPGDSLNNLDISWTCCKDFQYMAKNHCCAICMTNLLLALFPEQNLQKEILFPQIYKIIGNGPVFTLRRMRKFCVRHHLPLKRETIRDFSQLKSALSAGKPCAVLMANQLCNLHWVLAVGWVETTDGRRYIRIVDGWHSSAYRWYQAEDKAEWLSAFSFSRT